MKAIVVSAVVLIGCALGPEVSAFAQPGDAGENAPTGCGVSAAAQTRLRRVAVNALGNPQSRPVPDRFAIALGISGKEFIGKQAVIRNTDGIHTHVFAADANGSSKYLIIRMGGGPTEFFVTDSTFTPLAAVSYEKGALTKLKVADSSVCTRFQSEIALWAEANLQTDSGRDN